MPDVKLRQQQDVLTPLDAEIEQDQAPKKIEVGIILGREPEDEDQLEDVYVKLDDLDEDTFPQLQILDMDEGTGFRPRLEEVKSGALRDRQVNRLIRNVTIEQILKVLKSRGGSLSRPMDVTFEGAVIGGKGDKRILNLVPDGDSEEALHKDVDQIEDGLRESSGKHVKLKRVPFVFPVAAINYRKQNLTPVEADAAAEDEAGRLLEAMSQYVNGKVGKFAMMGFQLSPQIRRNGGLR